MKKSKWKWLGIPLGLGLVVLVFQAQQPQTTELTLPMAPEPVTSLGDAATEEVQPVPQPPQPPQPSRSARKPRAPQQVVASVAVDMETKSDVSPSPASAEPVIVVGRWEKHELRPVAPKLEACCPKGRDGVLLVGASWSLGGSSARAGTWQLGDAQSQTPLLYRP